MSGTGSLAVTVPIPSVPVFDILTGQLNQAWYRFFLTLWIRSGGQVGTLGVPGGAPGDVQFNNNGAFGGLSDAELTTHIQVFNSVLSGAVPQSGGGSTNFLRADGVFAPSIASGVAGGDLAGNYPNPTVIKGTNPTFTGVTVFGNGSFHLTSQTTDAGAQTATMTNSPTSGNPTFWLRVSINGVALAIPAWPA